MSNAVTRPEQERNRSEQDDSNRVGETFADVFEVQETENVVGQSCFHQRFLEDVVVVVVVEEEEECDVRQQVVAGGSEERSERVSQLPTLGTMSSSLSRPPSNSSHSSSSRSSSLPRVSLFFVNEFKPPSTHVSFGEDEKVRCRRTTDEGLLLSLLTLLTFFLFQFETSMR